MTPQQIDAMKLALEALQADELDMVDDGSGNMVFRKEQAITAIEEVLAEHAMQEVQRLGQEIETKIGCVNHDCDQCKAQTEQEPVEIDQATMELAESVGLIGPTSRTHDLHQAIQRFHDLICVNATVKAAQMAADVIRESTQPQRRPLTAEQLELLWDEAVDRMEHFCSQYWDFARAIEAAHGIKGGA